MINNNNDASTKIDRIILKGLTKIYDKKRVFFSPITFFNWLRMKFSNSRDRLNEITMNNPSSINDSIGLKAVDDLTFGVPKGECFGLLGVNGAGWLCFS